MATEKGLVLLITAPRTARKFEPLKGETISILDPAEVAEFVKIVLNQALLGEAVQREVLTNAYS